MAFVFHAHDLRLDREVAIKVLRPDLSADLGADRFLQEIRLAAQLQHPLILPLFDSGEVADGDLPSRPYLFYVMPLVKGETLRARLVRERQLPVPDALAIARDVAEALEHAHRQGIVHRDVKPENIFLTAGHALVADFGIARAVTAAGGPRITSQGVALGTPEYMSPEQASGDDHLDGRSDLYSLGCVLYEMLAGQPPFTGRTAQAIIARHLTERPPSLRVVRPTLPTGIEQVIETALGKVPADRFTTATKFVEALDRSPAAVRLAHPSRRWRRFGAGVLALAAVVALAVRYWVVKTAPLKARDWILVADFAGPSDPPGLAAALRDLVAAELNQSKYLRTMQPQQVHQAMSEAGLPETTTVTAERARELAVRSSVRAVVSGSITPISPGRFAAVVEVVDAGSGAPILATTGQITVDSFADGVQQLARKIRVGLGEHRQEVEADRPLYRVTTPSFPAYLKYSSGLDLAVAGNIAGSNRLLFESLALDTGFAAAWAALGMNFVDSRNLDSARIAYGEALRRPDRLTDAQRYRLEGDAAYALRHDLVGAVRAYGLFLQEVPGSIGGRSNMALYLSSMGRYEDALQEVDSAIAMDPFPEQGQIELLNRTALLISLGRLDDGRASLRRLIGPHARFAELQLAAAAGDWKTGDSLSRRPSEPNDPAFLALMANTAGPAARAALGDPGRADRDLAAAAAASIGSGARWYQRARLLLAMAERRRVGWTIRPDSTPAQALVAGLAAVLSGDTVRARRLLGRLEPLNAVERGSLGAGPELLRGLLDMRTGRPDSAARHLAPIAAAGEHDALSLDRVDSFWLRLAAADAFQLSGQQDSARVYLDLALQPERIPPSHYALRGLIYRGATERLQALSTSAKGQ